MCCYSYYSCVYYLFVLSKSVDVTADDNVLFVHEHVQSL